MTSQQGLRERAASLPTEGSSRSSLHPAGRSNRPSSKAAGESKPEAYPQGYVEDFDEPRTMLADCFSIQLKE